MRQPEARLEAASRRYYREGLADAEAGNLGGSIRSLEKALRYDKYHIDARNLLGLVQLQTGELGEAVRQWTISRSLQPRDNRAVYYLQKLRKEPEQLSRMEESIHLYNEALQQARTGSLDFAITRLRKAVHLNPRYVRAQMLLALCLIETGQFKSALPVLDKVCETDPLNPDAVRYRLLIARSRREGVRDASLEEIPDLSRDLYVQQALPEPDKEEIFKDSRRRRRSVRSISEPLMQILLFFAGVLCCLGFMQTLWYPDQIRNLKNEVQQLTISQNQLRDEKEELQRQLDEASKLLLSIADQSGALQAGVRADMQKLLEEWGLTDSLTQTEEGQ